MSTATTTPNYAEDLRTLRDDLKGMLPEGALAVFDEDAAKLAQIHTDILKLKEGDTAPDFALLDATGEVIQLSELLKQEKVVLTFYRGTWCPYCNLQLNLYQQILPQLKEAGATLVAISPQTPDESLNMRQKNELQFHVLSDPGNLVTRKYTTVFRYGDKPVAAMSELGFDFDSFYSDDAREIPVPAVFIINRDRQVTFAKAEGGDYRNRVEPSTILRALSA